MVGDVIQQNGSGLCCSARSRFLGIPTRCLDRGHVVSFIWYPDTRTINPPLKFCGEQSPVDALITCAVTMLLASIVPT